jgi:hypothetical protein
VVYTGGGRRAARGLAAVPSGGGRRRRVRDGRRHTPAFERPDIFYSLGHQPMPQLIIIIIIIVTIEGKLIIIQLKKLKMFLQYNFAVCM